MTFRVGQKVVCVGVGGTTNFGYSGAHIPVLNKVYTIREIYSYPERTLLTLYELDNHHMIGVINSSPLEPGFNARGFRPVAECKTDISVFTEILRTTKAPVNAEVGCLVRSQEHLTKEADHG